MIQNIKFLGNPSREKFNLFVPMGIFLLSLGLIDVTLNSLFETNITSFLPRGLNYFTPLIFGFLGLYYLRIEFSGNKMLDKLNININSNWFNSILTLLIIFVLIQNIPLFQKSILLFLPNCLFLLECLKHRLYNSNRE